MLRKIFIIPCLLGFCTCIFPQAKPFNIRVVNLTSEQGLLQNTVTCITKDHDGFIWIGTASGVSRYDGYEFRNYPHIQNDSTSLSESFVSSVFCDSKNNIWVGTTRNGINLYNRGDDNFRQITFGDNFNMNLIRCIFEDSKNNLWLGTLGAGLARYNPGDGKYIQYLHDDKDSTSIFGDFVVDIKEDENGRLWVSNIDGALNEFFPETGKFKRFVYNTSVYNNMYHPFRGRIMCRSGEVWICNYPDGLLRFNIAHQKFHVYPLNSNGTGLSGNDVTCVSYYTGRYYWVTIDHGGLNLIDDTRHKVYYYVPEPSQPNTLSNNQLLYIYKDNTDLFWVGSFKGGVNLFNTSHNNFVNYQQNNTSYGLSAKSALCIYQDAKNRIWVGTDGGGLDLLDPQKGVIKVYVNDPATIRSLSSDIITVIRMDHTGVLWIGTFGGGLNKFDPETNTAVYYSPAGDREHYLNSTVITDILEDSKHNLWVTTLNKGLNIKRSGSDRFEAVDSLAGKSLNRISLTRLLEDSRKRIWIGYDDYGVALYNPATDSLSFFIRTDDTTSISSNAVTCIFEDNNHRIWVGTQDGLNLFVEKGQKFIHINRRYNLRTSIFNSIRQDRNGFYWIGTTKGLIKLDLKTGTSRIYDYSDDLQGNEFNPNSVLISRDGRLYFGGVKGISAFYPWQIKVSKNIPPIAITEFYINNKPVTMKTPHTPLKQNITEATRIDLTYKQNFISFKYAALNYLHSEKNQYAYYLEPLEKEWNYVGDRRVATYTNLAPGNYIFHVKGSNHNLVWNETGKSLIINIIPPFWMTLWFKILLAVSVALLMFLIFYVRLKTIKAQKILLEKLVKDQTEELVHRNIILLEKTEALNETNTLLEERQQKVEEQSEELKSQAENLEKTNLKLEELNKTKDKFFSIIAHDLRSPFNSIFGFSELLQQKKDELPAEKRNTFIDAIHTSSKRIYSLLENLLQWSRMQADRIKFDPQEFPVIIVVNDVLELLRENAVSKNIKFEKKISNDLTVYADIDMVNTILRNILSNSIKFTPPGGSIKLNAKKKDDSLHISISDNGIGIPEQEIPKLFRIDESISTKGTEGESGTGLGLVLCKDFVEKNGGQIWIESKEGEGTTTHFTLMRKKKS